MHQPHPHEDHGQKNQEKNKENEGSPWSRTMAACIRRVRCHDEIPLTKEYRQSGLKYGINFHLYLFMF